MTARENASDLTRLERMERRLQALEDAEAIRNLKARYAALCDDQYDADGIAALFTEDALWESPALGRFEGREAIRGFFLGASGDLLLRDPLQLERPHRGGQRYRAGSVVSVHAVHGGRRKPSDVAGPQQHQRRTGGLDDPLVSAGSVFHKPITLRRHFVIG